MTTILIVEDDPSALYMTRYLLESDGFSVIDAEDGKEGVKKALGEKPDLVLMDVQLPVMDGLEATRKIREDPTGQMPIIAVTSYAMTNDREKAIEAGCNGYIEKPIDTDTFVDRIRKFLN